MTNSEILSHIDELIAEEHALRAASTRHGGLSDTERARLHELEVSLDQCWDLLRQRRARSEFGENPDGATTRPADQVERYQG
jgi:hypothetical protein